MEPVSPFTVHAVLYLTASEEESKTTRRSQPRGDDISDVEHLLDDQATSGFCMANSVSMSSSISKLTFSPSAPKAKRVKQEMGVVKQLFQSRQESSVPSHSDDITPPSSPEQYETADTVRQYRLCYFLLHLLLLFFKHHILWICYVYFSTHAISS